VEYLGFDLGELFDSAGLLPSDFLYDEGDDDDDAASTTSSSSGSAWGGGAAGSTPGQPAAGGWGGGGGVRDSAAVMMFQPRRLQRLKRRYEQLLRISLQVRGRPGANVCIAGGGGLQGLHGPYHRLIIGFLQLCIDA